MCYSEITFNSLIFQNMENDEIKNSTDEVLEINKAKRDFKIELALFFILGVLLGVTVKTEAVKRVTIGFNDYKVESAVDSYNVSAIKKKLTEEAEKAPAEDQAQAQEAPAPEAASCH